MKVVLYIAKKKCFITRDDNAPLTHRREERKRAYKKKSGERTFFSFLSFSFGCFSELLALTYYRKFLLRCVGNNLSCEKETRNPNSRLFALKTFCDL